MQFLSTYLAEILCLSVSIGKRVAKVHNTGLFWTVIQFKCMADLMRGFLEQTFNKDRSIGT
jgi:hypothetical protein